MGVQYMLFRVHKWGKSSEWFPLGLGWEAFYCLFCVLRKLLSHVHVLLFKSESEKVGVTAVWLCSIPTPGSVSCRGRVEATVRSTVWAPAGAWDPASDIGDITYHWVLILDPPAQRSFSEAKSRGCPEFLDACSKEENRTWYLKEKT